MMSYYILIMWLENSFFCMWMFIWGRHQFVFIFFKPLYLWFCLLEFQNNGQAFIQSRNIWHRDTERSHSDLCMCTPPLMCMWWVGWLYVLPCHLVAPTGFANATVWVTLRQFAPHHLIFLFFTPLSKHLFLHWQHLRIWAQSILLLFSSLLLFFCSVPLVVLDRLKLL